jgi:hypothetical protein
VIVAQHPDITRDTGFKFIGYWYRSELPKRWGGFKPAAKQDFPNPHDYVDASWQGFEREVIISYLKNGQPWEHWFGPSWCRFGCEDVYEELGCSDLTDGVYVWPSGFAHYVAKHDVKPVQEFLDHVLRR